MKKNTINLVTLGCSKNLVDSERLIRQLEACGYRVLHNESRPSGEYVIINTCGFIRDAKEQSIRIVLNYCKAKAEGKVKKLFVMGCLSQRYLKELCKEIPEVDKFYGKFDYEQLLTDLGKEYRQDLRNERHLTTPSHYAYLKISEGCNRTCAYCAIPLITGKHVSRPMEDIINEVKSLVSHGVKEFQVIAQELTYYGIDLYRKQMLPELVRRISDVPGVQWIRLHYAYPADFPKELCQVIRERDNVCKYLDIALQHISDNVLQRMRRHITSKQTYELIEMLREEIPGIHLRTTLMVGFPGETEDDFVQLLNFVKEIRFERLGAFTYSHEEGTYSSMNYEDNVPDEVKKARFDELMEVQQRISREVAAAKVGKELKVIIDRIEGVYYVGRSEFDSPEVDPEVLVPLRGNTMTIGNFYQVKINDSDEYDVYGTMITK